MRPGSFAHRFTHGTMSTRLLLLLLILLLGWALRTHNAGDRSLWEDEGWTMLLSKGPGLDDVARTLAADQHPPLYFMAFRLWRNVTGETEFAARYLGILIGMVAVAGAYQLGRELFNPLTGILAALMLALSDLHIDLSQEVRHYNLLATFVVLSSLFYVRWWRRPSQANRIGWVLASILLLYTHYLGGLILAAQLIHLLAQRRPRTRLLEGLLLFGAVGLGFLPWLPVMIDQNRVRWDNPLYYQNSLPNSLETYRTVRTAMLGQHPTLLALLALLGLVYVYRVSAMGSAVSHRSAGRLSEWFRPLWPTLFLVIWIVLVVSLTVIVNERRQFLTVRNFILITPALAVLIGHGLANLPRVTRLLVIGLVLVIGLTTVDSRREYPNWRAVTRNVTQFHLDGEPVLMDIWVGDFPVRYYIDRQMGEDTPRVSLREWRDQYRTLFLPTLLGYLQPIDSFWLIYWGDKPMDEYGGLIAEAGFQRTATFSVDHYGTPLYSYRYDKRIEPTLATFGDSLALRRSNAPDSIAPGETFAVALWWTAGQTPSLDYSVSVFLLDEAGGLVAQHDGPPLAGASPTSTWQPGELYYDLHRLILPAALPSGTYRAAVKVYWYGDNQPLPVRSAPDAAPSEYAVIRTFSVP